MNLNELFDDLIAVPGVQGAILFQPREIPKRYWPEDSECAAPNDKFLRGAGQIIRRLSETHDRIELRYQRGRFIIQSLNHGAAVGCFTGRELNLPLLKLTLDEMAQTAQDEGSTTGQPSLPTMPDGKKSAFDHANGIHQTRNGSGNGSQGGLSAAGQQVEEEYGEPLKTHAGIAAGLSDISMIATGYLGRHQVTSGWQNTQPESLQGAFQISQDGLIEAENDLAPGDDETILLARQWARAFILQTRLITIDLPLHLVAPLNADAQSLLAEGGSPVDRGVILLQGDYLSRLSGSDEQPLPEEEFIV